MAASVSYIIPANEPVILPYRVIGRLFLFFPCQTCIRSMIYSENTLESVERTRFYIKAEIGNKEVEAHMAGLIPCKENAFWLRKAF
jgi:hypothetical protein